MTKRKGYTCDICDEKIPNHGWWATFKRSTIRLKLRKWGIISAFESGWRRRRIDVCNDCWEELLEEVKSRVQ